jgi:hypothetical protein
VPLSSDETQELP